MIRLKFCLHFSSAQISAVFSAKWLIRGNKRKCVSQMTDIEPGASVAKITFLKDDPQKSPLLSTPCIVNLSICRKVEMILPICCTNGLFESIMMYLKCIC